eukprot:11186956-Lingulodinium_polyedra.AAC.1
MGLGEILEPRPMVSCMRLPVVRRTLSIRLVSGASTMLLARQFCRDQGRVMGRAPRRRLQSVSRRFRGGC